MHQTIQFSPAWRAALFDGIANDNEATGQDFHMLRITANRGRAGFDVVEVALAIADRATR